MEMRSPLMFDFLPPLNQPLAISVTDSTSEQPASSSAARPHAIRNDFISEIGPSTCPERPDCSAVERPADSPAQPVHLFARLQAPRSWEQPLPARAPFATALPRTNHSMVQLLPGWLRLLPQVPRS